MNIKRMKRIHLVKKRLVDFWYWLMKPVAYLLNKHEQWSHKRYRKKIKGMSEDKVLLLFAKDLIGRAMRSKWHRELVYAIAIRPKYFDERDLTLIQALKRSNVKEVSSYAYDRFSEFEKDWMLEENRRLAEKLEGILKSLLKDEVKITYIPDYEKYPNMYYVGYESTMDIEFLF